MKYNWAFSGPMLCLAAEGGTSGKNSSSDQRQLQATSQEGPVVGGDGNINTGTSASTNAGDVNITDQGAVNAAFGFGANVIAEVGKVFVNEAATQRDTVAANSANLSGLASLVTQNSAGGLAAGNNKTILYIVGAVLAVVALIFFLRR